MDDEKVLDILNRYWKELHHSKKRDYLLSCIEVQAPKKCYVNNGNRSCTYKYFMYVNNMKKTICRFLFNTLDIFEKVLR